MRWKVQWDESQLNRHRRRPSTYWTIKGYVVSASEAMQWAVGLTQAEVARWIRKKDANLKADDPECVPHTVPYHRQLKANVDALLALLEKK